MPKNEDEIKITPAMIEAGVEELSARYTEVRDVRDGAFAEAVAAILRASAEAARGRSI
jgi:hypothetical protein